MKLVSTLPRLKLPPKFKSAPQSLRTPITLSGVEVRVSPPRREGYWAPAGAARASRSGRTAAREGVIAASKQEALLRVAARLGLDEGDVEERQELVLPGQHGADMRGAEVRLQVLLAAPLLDEVVRGGLVETLVQGVAHAARLPVRRL